MKPVFGVSSEYVGAPLPIIIITEYLRFENRFPGSNSPLKRSKVLQCIGTWKTILFNIKVEPPRSPVSAGGNSGSPDVAFGAHGGMSTRRGGVDFRTWDLRPS